MKESECIPPINVWTDGSVCGFDTHGAIEDVLRVRQVPKIEAHIIRICVAVVIRPVCVPITPLVFAVSVLMVLVCCVLVFVFYLILCWDQLHESRNT